MGVSAELSLRMRLESNLNRITCDRHAISCPSVFNCRGALSLRRVSIKRLPLLPQQVHQGKNHEAKAVDNGASPYFTGRRSRRQPLTAISSGNGCTAGCATPPGSGWRSHPTFDLCDSEGSFLPLPRRTAYAPPAPSPSTAAFTVPAVDSLLPSPPIAVNHY